MIIVVGQLTKFNSNLWGYHLPLPADIHSLLNSDVRRLVVKIGNLELRCAIMYTKEYPFILLNQQLIKRNHWPIGTVLKANIRIDTSEYGLDVPEELIELLNQDPNAHKYFHELTKGKQRSLIYIVSKVKNTNSRLNKALAIADHLNTTKGNLDFKLLNERIKYYNNL